MPKNTTQGAQDEGNAGRIDHHNYYLRRVAGQGKFIGEYVDRASLANLLAMTVVSALEHGRAPRYETSPRYTADATSKVKLPLWHTPPGLVVAVNTMDCALGMIDDPAVRAMFAVRAAAALFDVFMDATEYAVKASRKPAARLAASPVLGLTAD